MRTSRGHGLMLLLVTIVGCERRDPIAPAVLGGPLGQIVDGANNGGNSHFFFLSPIVRPSPTPAGTLDAGLLPHLAVRICALDAAGHCGAVLATFTSQGQGPAKLRIENDEQPHFHVNWQTKQYQLDPATDYRITVLAAGTELGYADVDIVNHSRGLAGVAAGSVGVLNGQTLPIKFLVLEGGVFVIGTAGGTITAFGGAVTLVIPANALSGNTGITIEPSAGFPTGNGIFAVSGSVFDFAPDGLTFSAAAQLTIAYDETNLPAGVNESSLRLARLVGGNWQLVAGSTVNTATNTVTGPIQGFSTYGVVSFPTSPDSPVLSGFGSATIDGALGAEWTLAGRVDLSVNLPGGGTAPATLYVMNDATNLYLALQIQRGAADPSSTLQFTFDNDNDFLTEQGDDRLEVNTTGTAATFTDGFWCVDAGCSPPIAGAGAGVDQDVTGGSSDGQGAFAHSAGFSVYELSHPLNTADDAHDFSLAAGNTLGFNFVLNLFDAAGNMGFTSFPAAIFGRILIQPAPIPTLSGTGTATIDGVMSAGEWSNAACVFFHADVPGGGTVPAQFCVMNNSSNLYFALRYTRSVADPVNTFGVRLDQNNSGVIDGGDDMLILQASPTSSTSPLGLFRDEHWFSGGTCPANALCSIQDALTGGQSDGAGAFTHNGTHGVHEISHPLSSGDSFDISLSPAGTIGISASLSLGSSVSGPFVITFVPAGGLATVLIQ